MAVTLTGSGGLFTILGKIFYAQETLNTARGTTVPGEVQDVITAFEPLGDTIANQQIIDGLATAETSWRQNDTLQTALRTMAERLIIQMVSADTDLSQNTLSVAVAELIDQMEGSGGESNPDDDVDASAAGVTVTPGSNTGDGVIRASVTNGSGRNTENALAEAIAGTFANGAITLAGELAENNRLSANWPKGSGLNTVLGLTTPENSLLANGGFDDETERDNTPDDWIVDTGTIGTTIKMTDYEVQTVVISGTPTSGVYTLKYTDADSNELVTAPIAYNASGSTVQTRLRALTGLESVTVSTTGTTPNFTHTVTFTGVAGNVATLSSANTFDTGSIAHNQSTAGSANAYRGKAVEFDSDGSELTEIRQRVTGLTGRTVYAFNCFMKVDSKPAAGAVKIELIDGAENVLADAQGTSNAITVDPTDPGDLSTSAFTAIGGFFRTPAAVPDVVYLRIRISTAISNTSSLFIDDCALVQATQLYAGGPYAAAFAGATSFANEDSWTITVTNDRAGEMQEWFHRNFNLNVLLPSDSGGNETIDDAALIA